jgi:hypothetical protein
VSDRTVSLVSRLAPVAVYATSPLPYAAVAAGLLALPVLACLALSAVLAAYLYVVLALSLALYGTFLRPAVSGGAAALRLAVRRSRGLYTRSYPAAIPVPVAAVCIPGPVLAGHESPPRAVPVATVLPTEARRVALPLASSAAGRFPLPLASSTLGRFPLSIASSSAGRYPLPVIEAPAPRLLLLSYRPLVSAPAPTLESRYAALSDSRAGLAAMLSGFRASFLSEANPQAEEEVVYTAACEPVENAPAPAVRTLFRCPEHGEVRLAGEVPCCPAGKASFDAADYPAPTESSSEPESCTPAALAAMQARNERNDKAAAESDRKARASLGILSGADIDALSYRGLQAACKARGLPAGGTTEVLRARLRGA